MIIRSFRRVFHIERRVYSIPRGGGRPPIPVPVPGGVPVRGIAYFCATFVCLLVFEQVPVLGSALHVVSTPIRYVIIPAAIAILGMHQGADNRPAHRAAWDWLSFLLGAKRTSAGRPVAPEKRVLGGVLPVVWDDSAPTLQGGLVVGPCLVEFRVPVELCGAGSTMTARPGATEDAVVVLCAGVEMEMSP